MLKEDGMAFVNTLVVAAIFSASTPSPTSVAHTLMFRTPLATFIEISQSSHRDGRLDWSSDGCSAPVVGSTGRTFDFTAACQRHDFGYRNFKTLDKGKWWTSSMRHRIDRVFQQDMLRDCERRAKSTRKICQTWAKAFFRAVRAYSGP